MKTFCEALVYEEGFFAGYGLSMLVQTILGRQGKKEKVKRETWDKNGNTYDSS